MFFGLYLVFHSASERGRKELGTVRLLRSKGGGGGVQKSLVYQKLTPPQKKKKKKKKKDKNKKIKIIIYENCTAPLAIAIFEMHPSPRSSNPF